MATARDLVYAEIESMPEEDLDELYDVIKCFARGKAIQPRKPSALAKLKRIRIDAPEDFAASLDLYLSGEKQLATGQDVR